jgi:hypothetical protein
MTHRGSRTRGSGRTYGEGAVVEDMGTGYSLPVAQKGSTVYRVALRVGPQATGRDFNRVKRAAVRQLVRVVNDAGERYADGNLIERRYVVDGRLVWELSWRKKPTAPAGLRLVGDGAGRAGAPGADAVGGAQDVGGARG